jgi:phosphatidylinositol-3-phosphatase
VQTCRHPSSNQADETQHGRPGDGYAARHNPFVYFHSLLDLGDCASNDLPLTALAADLASPAKTPNYAFIAPNLCHDGSEAPCADGSPGGLQAADAFLAEWVPKILASPAYQRDGLLVITFSDGPATDTSGCCGATAAPGGAPPAGGGRVGALLLSRFVAPGGESTSPYNHYSLLRTVEDIFGVPHLANAGEAGVESFSGTILKGVFAHK